MSRESVLLPGLRGARIKRELKTHELAKISDVSETSIKRYESRTKPEKAILDCAEKLAAALGYPLGALTDPKYIFGAETQIGDFMFETPEDLSARFAADEDDVEEILKLRRMAFPNGTITPDETYWSCWKRTNKRGLRIIRDLGRPIGFWSMFPVSSQCFDDFVDGKSHIDGRRHKDFELTHTNMLAKFALPWEEVSSRSESYLYLAGIVVPREKHEPENSWSYRRRSGRIILDMMQVAFEVFEHINIKGICGYPTSDEGFRQLSNASLSPNGVCVDGNPKHPICVSSGSSLKATEERIKTKLATSRWYVPVWEERDVKAFLEAVKSQMQIGNKKESDRSRRANRIR